MGKIYTFSDFDPKSLNTYNPMKSLKAGGQLIEKPYRFSNEVWQINYSSILTRLIQLAGRFCESYASDLFIYWDKFDPKKKDENYKGEYLLLGMHDTGIDYNESVLKNYNNNIYFYRKIVSIETVVENNKLTMYFREF